MNALTKLVVVGNLLLSVVLRYVFATTVHLWIETHLSIILTLLLMESIQKKQLEYSLRQTTPRPTVKYTANADFMFELTFMQLQH